MSFLRFVRACRKYGFSFDLNTYSNHLTLVCRANNTYENITVKSGYLDFNKAFKEAIYKMKEYRKNRK